MDLSIHHSLQRLGDGQRQNAAHPVVADFAQKLLHIAARHARPGGVVHQHPIVGVHQTHGSDKRVVHRIAPRLATTIKRFDARAEAVPFVARELAVAAREHHEHRFDRRHANCSDRMPQHRASGDRHILLPGAEAGAAPRGRNQCVKRHRSSFNSGRYNYTVAPLMHRDSLPARRRYTRLAGSADALALARLAQTEKPLAVITAGAFDAQRLLEELRWFGPKLRVCLLPDWETLPYDQFSPHQDLVSERLATLYRIQRGDFDVAVMPAATALVRLCPPSYIAGHTFFLKAREKLSLKRVRQQLAVAGYQHVTQVLSPGEVCFRGGLIDLFPMGSALPYRIDLDDDVIDAIKTFDVDTQRTLYTVNEIRMLPAREFPLDDAGRARFRSRWRELFEGDPSKKRLYRDISNGVPAAGIEYYLPLFFDSVATLFDYLPTTTTLVLHHDIADAVQEFWRDANSRHKMAGGDPDRPLLPPAQLFVPAEEFFLRVKDFARVDLLASDEGAEK